MELVDVFDNKRNSLNKVIERYNNNTPGEFTQVVHLWIQNSNGEFLIQKRSMKKKVHPGMWSITGGAVDSLEEPTTAVARECKEEIGIELKPQDFELMMTVKRPSVFVDVYYAKKDIDFKDIVMQQDEVDDVKWASNAEIKDLIKQNEMGSSITIYYDALYKLIESNNG